MSSRFNCFRDSSSSPVVVTDISTSSSSSSRCQSRRHVPVEVAERCCSLQDPAVQRCVATDLQPGIAARRLGDVQSRRRGCSMVQCGTVMDGAPAGWVQLGPGYAVSGCRKELASASVSSPGVSPSSSSRSLHYLLQSPVRRYDRMTTLITNSHCHRQ